MRFVDGLVLRTVAEAEASLTGVAARTVRAIRWSTRWPRIHAVDPAAVGLGELGDTTGTSLAS